MRKFSKGLLIGMVIFGGVFASGLIPPEFFQRLPVWGWFLVGACILVAIIEAGCGLFELLFKSKNNAKSDSERPE
ncbi:MAG: hypothetical protein V1809_08355 [Planctomycetota bacterium]